MCKVARLFDPFFISENVRADDIEDLVSSVLPIKYHIDEKELLQELLAAYKAAAKHVQVDHDGVAAFSEKVLSFSNKTSPSVTQQRGRVLKLCSACHPIQHHVSGCSFCCNLCTLKLKRRHSLTTFKPR